MTCRDAWGRLFPFVDACSGIGEGWHSLLLEVYKLCEEHDVVLYQVKEKYGTLRIYVGEAPSVVHNLIDEMEDRSAHTCECCGQPATTRMIRHWVMTRCDSCIAKESK
jgi:hypothetical protein